MVILLSNLITFYFRIGYENAFGRSYTVTIHDQTDRVEKFMIVAVSVVCLMLFIEVVKSSDYTEKINLYTSNPLRISNHNSFKRTWC